ncbi:MAG: site-specific DNA-methyltransferase [Syntrophomonas sp.]
MEDGRGVKLSWERGEPHCSDGGTWEVQKVFPRPIFSSDDLFAISPCRRDVEFPDRLIYGDNLEAMKMLLQEGYEGKIDLIYIDPPYLSESHYSSHIDIKDKKAEYSFERKVFNDSWGNGMSSYLDHMYHRLVQMKKLLNENGSIFVHLDWHISHYIKIMLDELFSPAQLINEIVWCYGGGSGAKRHFHRKHDVILWYAKGHNYTFNPQYRPYTPGTRERGLTRVKGDRYRLKDEGAIMQDWWTDINKILSPTAYENLKYPTQKPLALLMRLLEAASKPGSLAADFYGGSGTLADACDKSGRKWVSCDNSPIALHTTAHRLIQRSARPFTIYQPAGCQQLSGLKVYSIPYGGDLKRYNVSLNECQVDGLPAAYALSYWALDLDHEPGGFVSDLQVIREKHNFNGALTTEIGFTLSGQKGNTIGIKAYDFWGREYYGRFLTE